MIQNSSMACTPLRMCGYISCPNGLSCFLGYCPGLGEFSYGFRGDPMAESVRQAHKMSEHDCSLKCNDWTEDGNCTGFSFNHVLGTCFIHKNKYWLLDCIFRINNSFLIKLLLFVFRVPRAKKLDIDFDLFVVKDPHCKYYSSCVSSKSRIHVVYLTQRHSVESIFLIA